MRKGECPVLAFRDELVEALSEAVCGVQRELVKERGLSVARPDQAHVEPVIKAAFGITFGCDPAQREGYSDLFDQVADYARRLATAHPFPDANKRTTVVTSMAMIYSQGISLRFDDDPDPIHNTLYQWVQDIVEHKVEYTELAERLRSRARKRPRSSPGEGGSGDGRSIV